MIYVDVSVKLTLLYFAARVNSKELEAMTDGQTIGLEKGQETLHVDAIRFPILRQVLIPHLHALVYRRR